jgi:hypothetical protein
LQVNECSCAEHFQPKGSVCGAANLKVAECE